MTTQLSYDAECHRKVTERRERYSRSIWQNEKRDKYLENGLLVRALSLSERGDPHRLPRSLVDIGDNAVQDPLALRYLVRRWRGREKSL